MWNSVSPRRCFPPSCMVTGFRPPSLQPCVGSTSYPNLMPHLFVFYPVFLFLQLLCSFFLLFLCLQLRKRKIRVCDLLAQYAFLRGRTCSSQPAP